MEQPTTIIDFLICMVTILKTSLLIFGKNRYASIVCLNSIIKRMTPIFHQEAVISVNVFLKIIQQMLSLFQQTVLALFTPGFTTFQKTLSGVIVMINRQQKKYSPPPTHPPSLLLILKFQGRRQSLLTDIDVLWYLDKHKNTPPH